MTTLRDGQALSDVELVVLMRLPTSKGVETSELCAAVRDMVLGDRPQQEVERAVEAAVSRLRANELLHKTAQCLSVAGSSLLRAHFGVAKKPSWQSFSSTHLPALALDLKPGSDAAERALETTDAMGLALLKLKQVTTNVTFNDYCDQLIAKRLGMKEPVSLATIRAHVLGEQLEIPIANVTKTGLGRALSRCWFYKRVQKPAAPTASPRSAVAEPPAPRSIPPAQPVPTPHSAASLLDVVRQTLPRIGSDGRFGAEKVFVSAIWRRIEHDRLAPDMSLDRFKRWLVSANREQLLDLARADLVGAMDAKLVADSEIEDKGATFHFVVDRRTDAGGRAHAR